jgi:transposase-like protein
MLVRDGRDYNVSARDAAAQLGIHEETLKRWCRQHRVDARKNFVGHWMLSQESIAEVLTLPETG